MASREAVIKRVRNGGTCSIKGLARQMGYLSRQNDPDRETIELFGAQRHDFAPGTPDAVNPNDVWAFARRVYERSGRLPPDDLNGDLANDLTMHFVFSFPAGTDLDAAERAGRDWAEYVFGHGYRNDQGFMQRHDYVTAFHRYDNDSDHPHMHVIVDRSPLGGGNLLRLHEGHPHWSYEAMRVQAVEAAANHGIELVATTRADRGLTDRPMTDVEFRQFQRLLTQRPITQDEALRRQADGAAVPYSDTDYEIDGVAPDDGEDPADRTADDLRRGCTPTFLEDDDDDDDPGPFNPGGGGGDEDDGDGDGDGEDRRRRSTSPPPSPGRGSDDRRGSFQARRHDQSGSDDEDEDNARGDGAQRQQTQGAKRKRTEDDPSGPADKRPRKNQTGGDDEDDARGDAQRQQTQGAKRKRTDDDPSGPADKRPRKNQTGEGGHEDDGDDDGDDQDRRRRSASPPPSPGRGSDDRRGSVQARRHDRSGRDDEDPDDARGGAQRQQTQGAKRKQTDDDPSGPANKRPRKNQTGGGDTPMGNRLDGGRPVPDNRAGASLPLNAANLERLQQELHAQRMRSLAAQQAARDEAADRDRPPPTGGNGEAGDTPHDERGAANADAGRASQDDQRRRKRGRPDDGDQTARKRSRIDRTGAGPANDRPAAAATHNQHTPAPPARTQRAPADRRGATAVPHNAHDVARPAQGQSSGVGAPARQQGDTAEQRREAARSRRQASLAALHAHRETRDVVGGNTAAWQEQDRQLLREARLSLIEHRRAHAGITNVETRAQRQERLRLSRNQGTDGDRRDGRDPRNSRGD